VGQQEPEGAECPPAGRNAAKGKDFAWVVRQVVGSSVLLSAAEFSAASALLAISADVVVEPALAMADIEQV
jgi:hypothetical protein